MIVTLVLLSIFLCCLLYFFLMRGGISPTVWWRTVLTYFDPDSSWLRLGTTSRFEFYQKMYNQPGSDSLFYRLLPFRNKKPRVVRNREEATAFGKLIKRPDSNLEGRPMLKTVFHENDEGRWHSIRKKLVKQVFSKHLVDTLRVTMHTCVMDTITDVLKNNETNTIVDVVKLSRQYITKILARCVFGHFQDEEDDFSRHCVGLRHEESNAMKCGLPGYFSDEEVYFRDLMETSTSSPEATILSALKECFDSDTLAIQSNAIAFILGGFTSMASTLTFSLYEIAANPQVQNILCNQAEKNDDSYLEWVMKEVLRKYPPFPIVIKQSDPATTWILPISGLHYDPRIYGEDPSRFVPERFAEPLRYNSSSEDNTPQLPPSAFFCPFGIGKRKCPGDYFAYTVIKVFLKNLLENYYIQPPSSEKLQPLQFTPKKFTTSVSRLDLKLTTKAKI